MGASHEAEIHGNAASLHRAESVVGDAEPIAELTETMGQTGESAPGPGLMDEFVPEVDREEPNGDSQDMVSRSVGQADSGSKIYGCTKTDSVESGEMIGHADGNKSSRQPSLSCNAGIYAGFDLSKDDVTQAGKILTTDGALMGIDYDPGNGLGGGTNGENDYESGLLEFHPVKHHNSFCPWVNGIVAAACCNNIGSSSSSSALSGWQLTIDAYDTFQSLGQAQNQIMQSDSAASLYMDDQITHNRKLGRRPSLSRSFGKC